MVRRLPGGGGQAHQGRGRQVARRPPIRAHLLCWSPRACAQRTASTPRAGSSGSASQLDPSRRPAPAATYAESQQDGTMLSLNNIEVIYDGVILVLKGVSIEV